MFNNKTEYVLCYGLNMNRDKVVVMKKNRPWYLAGKWNAPGGGVEHAESIHEASTREFEEETGIKIMPDRWESIGRLEGEGYVVHCLVSFTDDILNAKTMTDEEVKVIEYRKLLIDIAKNNKNYSDDLGPMLQVAVSSGYKYFVLERGTKP